MKLCVFTVALAALSLTGCSLLQRLPKVSIGKSTAIAPRDAGSPATVETREEKGTLDVPAGTKVRVTQEDAVPATSSTPYLPARTLTEWEFSLPATFSFSVDRARGSTGTVDTSVAKSRIAAEERRPLLYCAIGAVVLGLGFMYVRFQALAVMSFLASGTFFLAWRMSEISPWVGGLFLAAAIAGYAFYKRAEWDRDGDGIPDALQRKS